MLLLCCYIFPTRTSKWAFCDHIPTAITMVTDAREKATQGRSNNETNKQTNNQTKKKSHCITVNSCQYFLYVALMHLCLLISVFLNLTGDFILLWFYSLTTAHRKVEDKRGSSIYNHSFQNSLRPPYNWLFISFQRRYETTSLLCSHPALLGDYLWTFVHNLSLFLQACHCFQQQCLQFSRFLIHIF